MYLNLNILQSQGATSPTTPEPEWSETPSEVLHLNDDDYRLVLKKKKHALVMFYAPCKFCVVHLGLLE